MDISQLKTALERADSRAGWVESVDRYFASHELFYGHGTDNSRDEAFWLVWQLSGTPADLSGLAPETGLIKKIVELAAQRVAKRIPLGYLLGVAWFAGLEFEVSQDVLIPRSPFAELVARGFAPWIDLAEGDRVLEIGTGSGCIAIAAAVLHPTLDIDATEIDPAALALARRNRLRHGVEDRVQLHAADLFPVGDTRYRVIISNPPYVPTRDVAALPREYGHEPVEALDGGTDGLEVVRRILDGAGQRLTDDGVLIVEVGLSADRLQDAYPEVPWTWLEFEMGGDGVFLLTADELNDGWG